MSSYLTMSQAVTCLTIQRQKHPIKCLAQGHKHTEVAGMISTLPLTAER